MDQHDKISILRASHTLAKMGSIESRRGTADATSSEGQVAKREDSQERADYRSLELRARERRVPNGRNSSLCFGTLYGSSETRHRGSAPYLSGEFERVAVLLSVTKSHKTGKWPTNHLQGTSSRRAYQQGSLRVGKRGNAAAGRTATVQARLLPCKGEIVRSCCRNN